jgi:hypothetical protein
MMLIGLFAYAVVLWGLIYAIDIYGGEQDYSL